MNSFYLEKGRPVEVITRWAQPSKRNPLPLCPPWLIWHRPPKPTPPKNVAIMRPDGSTTIRPFRGLRRAPMWVEIDDLPLKLRGRISPQADGCWHWMGPRGRDGYGRIFRLEGGTYVHRQVFERLVGKVPAGLQLDHLCRVRHCCNPAHLEPVTPRENTLRGVGPTALNAIKSHCPQGHEFDVVGRRGERHCSVCEKAQRAERLRGAAKTDRPKADPEQCRRGHRYSDHGYIDKHGHKNCQACHRERERARNAARDAAQGVVRSPAESRTHCPKGHPYNEVNTYIARKADGTFRARVCRKCRAALPSYNKPKKERKPRA